MLVYDIIGWVGMVMVLVAYLLLSLGKISNGKLYQYLNLVAAILMAIALFPKDAWFSFALQVAWGVISVVALIKIYRGVRKNRGTRKKQKTHSPKKNKRK